MRELTETIARWRTENVGFGRAVLLRAFGSAPRQPGATLLVADDGRLIGSVSGGCVESACVEEVARARKSGESRVVRYGIGDETAWSVGLACGSTIDVLIQPTLPDELLSAASTSDERGAAVLTELPPGSPGPTDGQAPPASAPPAAPRVVTDADGGPVEVRRAVADALGLGRSSVVALASGQQMFVEAFAVPPRLVVFGAVDIARSLVRLAHELGFRVWVVDAREAFLTEDRFPDADRRLLGWPDEVADELALRSSDAVAVLTHDPKLDDPAVVAALSAGCAYVGAIGSRRTQAARRERLRQLGVTDDELRRLHGPIGLDLGGREPAETALAILSEVVALRYGARGGSLAER